jgi:S1-C subfamily serine protease
LKQERVPEVNTNAQDLNISQHLLFFLTSFLLPKLMVHYVRKGSPASGSLIESGEYLESVDGVKINSLDELFSILNDKKNKTASMRILSMGFAETIFSHYTVTMDIDEPKYITEER